MVTKVSSTQVPMEHSINEQAEAKAAANTEVKSSPRLIADSIIADSDFERRKDNAVTGGTNIKKSTSVHHIVIGSIFEYIMLGNTENTDVRSIVEQIRNAQCAKERNELKLRLPWFSGALFSKDGRKDESFRQLNFLILDVDHVEDQEEMKKKAIELLDPSLKAAFRSPSDGIKLIYALSEPIKDRDLYRYVWTYLTEDISSKLGLSADMNASGISQATYLSYDPNLALNPNQVPLDIDKMRALKDAQDKKKTKMLEQQNRKIEAYYPGSRDYEFAHLICKHLISQGEIKYLDWIIIGMALKARFGEGGRELFQLFANNPCYNDSIEFIDKKWNSFGSVRKITYGSLVHVAKQYGW